jgi:photosystem II stability/assembly factor-like uncharacterized protein
MLACLSPNGQMRYESATPPTRLVVATATGVAVLDRAGPGADWHVAGRSLEKLHVSTMTALPGHPGLFAGTHGDGIYYSADGGMSWEERDAGVHIRNIYSLAGVERNGGIVVYAGTEPASLFRSTDLGKSWRELSGIRQVPGTEYWTFPAPPRIAHTKMLAFDPRNPDRIYAAIEQGAFLKSEDGGETWREFADYSRDDDRAYRDVHMIMLVPSRPETILMTTGVGLYRSDDGGARWERLTGADFRLAYPDHIALSPDEKTLFMSGAKVDPGVWRKSHDAGSAIVRSRDGGKSWELLKRGVPETAPCAIEGMSLVSYPGGYSLFVGNTDGEVFASEDGGDSWSRIAGGLGPVSKGNHFEPLSAAARAQAVAS